jgi:hypothetical protein
VNSDAHGSRVAMTVGIIAIQIALSNAHAQVSGALQYPPPELGEDVQPHRRLGWCPPLCPRAGSNWALAGQASRPPTTRTASTRPSISSPRGPRRHWAIELCRRRRQAGTSISPQQHWPRRSRNPAEITAVDSPCPVDDAGHVIHCRPHDRRRLRPALSSLTGQPACRNRDRARCAPL